MIAPPLGSGVHVRRLTMLVAVASERHFGRAAKRLGVSQATLSEQISALEADLHVDLLIRDSRNVRLSAVGEALMPDMIDLLAHAESFANRVAHVARFGAGAPVRVSCAEMASRTVMAQVLTSLKRDRPTATFDCGIREHPLGVVDVRSGVVDAYLTFYIGEPVHEGLDWIDVASDLLVVLMSASDPFMARESVSLSEVLRRKVSTGPAYVGQLRSELDRQFARIELPPDIVYHAPNYSAHYLYVASGQSVTLIASRAAKDVDPSVLVTRPLTDPLPIRWGFVCRPDLSSATRLLLKNLRLRP